MIRLRPVSFVLCLLLGMVFALLCQASLAVSGWGAVLGVSVWFLADSLAAAVFARAVRHIGAKPSFHLLGFWGRMYDLFRARDRRSRLKVREANERLDEIFRALQASPNGVTLLDAEDRIEFTNAAAAEHFSWDARQDLGQYVHFLIREPGFAEYLTGPADGEEVEFEISVPDAPTLHKHIALQFHAYHGVDGRGRKLLLSRDVGALYQAESMRRDFVANVSHEIATPVTVVAGFIETMQTYDLDKQERDRQLGLMAQQTRRIKTLVQDLLVLARLEGSPIPSKSVEVPVDELLLQCSHDARALAYTVPSASENIVFENDYPKTILLGTRHELQSAMTNLVTNAIRYTPAPGRVVVRWQVRDNGTGVFSVSDTGMGIAPEHINRLTERFYRVDSSRSRNTGGTGLGLAIVKHVVQRHGGELQIDSVLGEGSCFAIILPADRLQGIDESLPSASIPLSVDGMQVDSMKTVEHSAQ